MCECICIRSQLIEFLWKIPMSRLWRREVADGEPGELSYAGVTKHGVKYCVRDSSAEPVWLQNSNITACDYYIPEKQ
ncbi:hypothetical protein DPMN_122398 [Dreissena polymorpha]|uniref:Uncharacterized protein n=1 Tax=Dreissena polymorpha TaxID=45954 RepID=A0A9D4GNH8_DREPO|nr:hypothetical protein DPMN_122398 [Dreissena polymorpha]